MSLKIVVLAKQVPDTRNVGKDAMTAEGTVNRAALPAIFNPEDLNALEQALRLKEQHPGSTVGVLTMGPPRAGEIIRQGLYRGADTGWLLTDRLFAGADTLATSYALSKVVEKLGNVDLVLCGRQAIDGDTAQVGPQIAEKLHIPQICYVEEVQELSAKSIRCRRAIEGGYEVLESPLPALLTVIDANSPRPMNAKKIMKFKRSRTPGEVEKEHTNDNYTQDAEAAVRELRAKGLLIEQYSAADIGAEPDRIGFAGSPTKVKQVMSVVLTAGEAKRISPDAAGIGGLIHELISDHTLG